MSENREGSAALHEKLLARVLASNDSRLANVLPVLFVVALSVALAWRILPHEIARALPTWLRSGWWGATWLIVGIVSGFVSLARYLLRGLDASLDKVTHRFLRQITLGLDTILVRGSVRHDTLRNLIQPVAERCLEIMTQAPLPIAEQVQMRFTCSAVEPLRIVHGDYDRQITVVRIRRSIRFACKLERPTEVASLCRPVLVCTDGVLNDGEVLRFLERNGIEWLFPVPHVWRGDSEDAIRAWRKQDWVQDVSLRIGGNPVNVTVVTPPTQESFEACLTPYLPEIADRDQEVLRRIEAVCLQVITSHSAEKFIGQEARVEYDDVYTVAMAQTPEQEDALYRYRIPITYPQIIQEVHFELAENVASDWELVGPFVGAAFPPEMTWSPMQCDLTWAAPGSGSHGVRSGVGGAPFLTGHGIVFMWRRKPHLTVGRGGQTTA